MKPIKDLREIASYRELIVVLAMREIRVRYKYTLLGAGWALALPVSMMLVFTFVFSNIASVNSQGIPYPVFAYLGLLPWQLHANIVNGSARSLVDNRALVTKVYFAREVLPLSQVLSALADFVIASLVLAGLMVWFDVTPSLGILLVPFVLLIQLAFSFGVGLVLSGANLLYRDVQFFLQVGMLLWMFASAVVYPIPRTGDYAWLAYVNPMTPILDAYRVLVTGHGMAFGTPFVVATIVSFATLAFGWRWFRRIERRFGELA